MGELRCSISNTLHKELKQKALDKGITLKQLITNIFQDYIKGMDRSGNKAKRGNDDGR